ncbi:MAG: c-type cytochrome [Acidobacteria bacterium]|nr:c-type cytochrome [Acidobacteriota bacterium]
MLPWVLSFAIRVPLGLDSYVPAPPENPITKESAELGRRLFRDKRLSRDNTIACATCHDAAYAFTDREIKAKGIRGQVGPRRSPRLLNRAWGQSFFWDGRVTALEQQVAQPISNPLEMDLPVAEAAAKVGLDELTLRRALATYVRTILAGNSPYDRYLNGERSALDAQQQKGLQLFRGKAGCISCHLGPNLTDEAFHVTGAGRVDDDAGRALVSLDQRDTGAFKTPSLRHIAKAAPYFHDGSASTLEAVVEHYNAGGRARKNLDPEMRPLRLTADEKAALVRFLEALTGEIREGLE